MRACAGTGAEMSAARALRAGRRAGHVFGLVIGFGVGLLVLGAAEASSAQDLPAASAITAGSGWAYDLAGELMSPFCPGRTLASCPSPQAGELIQWIAMQEAAGVGRDEVIAMLVERHGEEILGRPPARGITLWTYVLPVVGFVGFGLVAVVSLRRLVGGRADGAAQGLASAGSSGAPASSASSASSGATATAPTSPPPSNASSASREDLARLVDAELAERA